MKRNRKMKHIKVFAILLALFPLAVSAQEERIDTVIPKFLSNGYFFREMPKLPDGEKTLMRLKDKEGNRRIAIDVKNMNPEALHYDRAGDLPSVEKVSKKEERLGCRLIIVNIVKINQPGLNESVEILGLIDENGVPCLDKLNQLKFLIQGK